MFDIAYLSQDATATEPNDIPLTKEPVWVLGKRYSAIQDIDKIRRDITSIIWFTYRKGFIPIGDDGLTTDKGWGCMLRCGQMALAQALVRVHMQEDWYWNVETRDPTYLKIIQRFEERRQSPFSIHQIALMGACEGKEVGQWFGPNTVAQVLKKLVVYDNWSSLAIHVALDNTIVKDDIKKLCLNKKESKKGKNKEHKKSKHSNSPIADSSKTTHHPEEWKPLLLIIPLRLGLCEINPIYINGLKMCFCLPQSLGVIGGKPNQALYLIGCVEDEVLYLDPHTTQKAGYVENKETEDQKDVDFTYHCKFAQRFPIMDMDPSVAVCFICKTQAEFNDLCSEFERSIMKESQPLFEICKERPKHWGPNNADLEQQLGATALNDFEELDRQFDDSDDEFEIL